jgi:hypothetical protein
MNTVNVLEEEILKVGIQKVLILKMEKLSFSV